MLIYIYIIYIYRECMLIRAFNRSNTIYIYICVYNIYIKYI